MSIRVVRAALAGAAGAVGASSAFASPVLSLTYQSLEATYTDATNVFTARAVDNGVLSSSAIVEKYAGPSGVAQFAPGFTSSFPLADFLLVLADLDPLNPTSNTPNFGYFQATDIHGDTITGSISGTWNLQGPGFVAFTGTVTNAAVTLLDGEFNGSTGSWNDTNVGTNLDGAIVQLLLPSSGLGLNLFTDDFSGEASTVNIQLVPTPGSIAMLGLGGLIVGRRKR